MNWSSSQPSFDFLHQILKDRVRSFEDIGPAFKMSVTIRAIQDGDKEGWLPLWDQYNEFYKRTIPTNVTDTTFSRFLDDKVRMYAAVAVNDSGKVVGFAHWYPHASTSAIEETVYLHDLFVDPSTRNAGVGRKLIAHVTDYSKQLPAEHLYWHTQHFNHRAQLLYTKVATKTDFVMYSVETKK